VVGSLALRSASCCEPPAAVIAPEGPEGQCPSSPKACCPTLNEDTKVVAGHLAKPTLRCTRGPTPTRATRLLTVSLVTTPVRQNKRPWKRSSPNTRPLRTVLTERPPLLARQPLPCLVRSTGNVRPDGPSMALTWAQLRPRRFRQGPAPHAEIGFALQQCRQCHDQTAPSSRLGPPMDFQAEMCQ